MKRAISFLGVLAFAVLLWGGSHAALQTEGKEEIGNTKDSTTDAASQIYFGKSSKHKMFIDAEDTSLYNELLNSNAITREVDCGSFKMVVIEEEAIGGRTAMMNFRFNCV